MSTRIGPSALIALLGLVILGVFALSSSPAVRAGAPPRVSGDPDGPTVQQRHAPAQLAGSDGWDLISPFPDVKVPFPDEERAILKPARIKRAGAAVYPPNGKIYLLGGRMGIDGMDNPISSNNSPLAPLPTQEVEYRPPYAWIFEYAPDTSGGGTWVRKQADIDPCPAYINPRYSVQCPGERYTSNMAVATLSDGMGVAIFGVGGSSVSSVPTKRVFRYNPISDSIAYLTSDPWPASPARIPGGYAVLNNKLYVFGGFDPRGSGAVYGETWVFDPMASAGSRWTRIMTANLTVPRAYIAGVALGGYVYAIGGDTWQSHADVSQRRLVPANMVERLDPSAPAPVWQPVASLPQPRGDLGAWAYEPGTGFGISGKVVVAGGHSSPPGSGDYLVPDNLAYMFDPPSAAHPNGSWTAFVGLTNATRNFGYAAHNGFLYAIGGYDYGAGRPDSAGFTQRFDANGSVPTTTPTASATGTSTPTRTVTGTQPTETPTGGVTNTPVATPTACSVEFRDVAAGSTFYPFVRCLACRGVIGGYPCGGPGEPCNAHNDPYFRPGGNITRGQIAKIVSESAHLLDDQDEQFYQDVPPGSPFYDWINRLSWRGYMGGYACGSAPGEPCGEGHLPYFRPNASATRGQLSKIVANAALIDDAVSGQTYADVPPSADSESFYVYIERLTRRNVMGGYACGTGEPNSGPCDERNRPFFRPGNPVTRGQAAKIVANTFFPNCQTPARR